MTTTTSTTNAVDIAAVTGLATAIAERPGVAATTWSSKVVWDEGFRSSASVRDFAPIGSDEPVALGGTDTAPNPVEQLLSALGNCLVVGFAANATLAGITVDQLEVELEGDLDLHTFLGLDPEGNAGFESIRAKVTLSSDATEAQLSELREKVVGTSPVGHTLGRAVPVSIAVA